ncbi:MAG: protein kinase [Planctomycetales bacterium]|nr:protein kinase [Planctomycetales bacterium]
MAYSPQDRDFLICLLARRRGWVTDAQLEAAARRWADEPSQSLAELLESNAKLSPEQLGELRSAAAAEALKTRTEPVDSQLAELPDSIRALLSGSADTQLHTPRNNPFATRPSDRPHAGSRVTKPEELPQSDRFEIVQLHAQGGLGAVFLARDSEIDRTVALKQIKSQWADDGDSRARFLLEAKITGRLEHPGIVPIYALGADASGRPYYAMRFIRGESMLTVIERFLRPRDGAPEGADKLPELRRLLARFVEVCNALEYAHSRGIIHRDVKPANVMLGRYGETLVVDWGLAKVIGDEEDIVVDTYTKWTPVGSGSGGSGATRMGAAVGTPAYMSPEQAAGRLNDLGPQSDVYSLGATLYQLLTGQVPHDATDDIGVLMAQIDRGQFRSPREREHWIPKALSAICMKALRPLPEDRYASAGAMGEDLQRWLSDEPVRAYADSFAERTWRWMRNHRTLVISAVATQAVAAAAIVIGAIGWSHFQEKERQQQLAIDQQQQQRLAELEASANAATQTAIAEIHAGRFAAAASFLDRAVASLSDEPQYAELRNELSARQERASQLSEFQRLGETAEELNFFQHDAEAQALLYDALDRIGAFDHGDWWNHLPADDLTPAQLDDLQFDVYRKLVLLTAVHSKKMLRAGITSSGAAEARDLLAAAELTQRFRPTQVARFFAGGARLRLGQSFSPPPAANSLDDPVTAADAYMLGGLWVVATQNKAIAATYGRGETDFLGNARRKLALVESLEPNDYWSHFLLGFIELIEAGDPQVVLPSVSRPHYAAARAAMGHSIAIKPDYWLSYAERSGASRQEVASRRQHPEDAAVDDAQREREDELLRWMIHDVQRAVELASTRAEVQWYVAFAHWIADNREAAVDGILHAIQLGERFDVEVAARMIDPERQRALPESLQIANALLTDDPGAPRYLALRADVRLQLGDEEGAWDDAAAALADANPPAAAFAVRGRLLLDRGEPVAARRDLRSALAANPRDIASRIGVARSYEKEGDPSAALAEYDETLSSAETAFQRAACELGRARSLLALDRHEDAIAAAAAAVAHKPSCELTSVEAAATRLGVEGFLAAVEAKLKPRSVADRIAPLAPPAALPLLNGGFELGLGGRHWNNDDVAGLPWHNTAGCQSVATIVDDQVHSGSRAMHISFPLTSANKGYGVSTQTVPADPQAKYRISLWAKSQGASAGAVQIVLDDRFQQPLLTLSAGDYDWRECSAEFTVSELSTPTVEGYRNVTFRIIAAAPGETWIDDIRVTRQTPTPDASR